MGKNFNLASIHDLKENAFVASLVENQESSFEDIWLGGVMKDDATTLSWSDYTPFNMDNWAMNQPDDKPYVSTESLLSEYLFIYLA